MLFVVDRLAGRLTSVDLIHCRIYIMQIIGCERWERISVPLPEIEGCTDFEVLSHNYRSARPVALITPLKNLSDCVAVNLLAPPRCGVLGRFGLVGDISL